MKGYTFSFSSNPLATDFELQNRFGADDFVKHRLKSSGPTLDIAIVDVEDEEEYIDSREEEFQDMEIRVPSPYTSEINREEQDDDYPLEFDERDGRRYGLGFAGPEYKLMLKSERQIPRYRYLVTWKFFDNIGKLAEIEVYIPKDDFELEDAFELVENISVE